MKALFVMFAVGILIAPHARAAEPLKFAMHFGLDNPGDFCTGVPEDFEASCSPVELGGNLDNAKKKFAEFCKNGFRNVLIGLRCSCDLISADSNGRGGPLHPNAKPPRFNKRATPRVSRANLGFYSGPSNGAAFFIFKNGKPDAWSDGGNIDCTNIEQNLSK